MSKPRFEVVTTSAGALSIRNLELNETMHNPVGPWIEANALYIEQSKMAERLKKASGRTFVLFDVGLGAAANSIAALHCARSVPGSKLKIVSFERDLELGHFALANAARFPHFAGWETALYEVLKNGQWSDGQLEWVLREGDFLEKIKSETEIADLIFYDPYSHKVNREMWSAECFALLRAHSHNGDEHGTLLYTYSQSTPVRVALLRGGFYIGRGSSTGLKEETTQASTRLMDLDAPLAQAWLKRWSLSHIKYPLGMPEGGEADLEAFVKNHKQFNL